MQNSNKLNRHKKIMLINIIFIIPSVLFFTCMVKFGLTDYLLGIRTWQTLGDLDAINNDGVSSLSVSNGVPYIAYKSYTSSPALGIPKVKKFINETWTDIGNLSTDWWNYYIDTRNNGSAVSLSVANGIPYIALKNATRFYLMRYTGSRWLSDASFDCTNPYSSSLITISSSYTFIPILVYEENKTINNYATPISLNISPGTYPSLSTLDNTPCVAFYNAGNINVIKYNGSTTNWNQTYPSINCISGQGDFITFRSYNNAAFICYQDGQKINVKKLSSINWTDLGTFKNNIPLNAKISYDRAIAVYNEMLYIAFTDPSRSNKATIHKCSINGGDWELVGERGFTTESAYNIGIQVDRDIPFISYHSGSPTGPIKVMKYDLKVKID
jgi:hypothetical protein